MTSIKRFIIKPLSILMLVVAALSFSAVGISKQSTLESQQNAQHLTKKPSKPLVLPRSKSNYERKLKRQILALLPGERQFNQKFLHYVLTSPIVG